jgi:uncharacterized membrane protein YtjA (UPF0391 family)
MSTMLMPRLVPTRPNAERAVRRTLDCGLTGEEVITLSWSVAFFVIATIAAILGFSGFAAGAAVVARVLFMTFLVLAMVSLAFGRGVPASMGQGRRRPIANSS